MKALTPTQWLLLDEAVHDLVSWEEHNDFLEVEGRDVTTAKQLMRKGLLDERVPRFRGGKRSGTKCVQALPTLDGLIYWAENRHRTT